MAKVLSALFLGLMIFFMTPLPVQAQSCDLHSADPNQCGKGYSCQPTQADPSFGSCKPSVVQDLFGKVTAPDALKNLVSKDATGTGGIGIFLSNLVRLIYSLAAVVLIFMILWGAFDWMTSAGDKERLQSAQRKIINAIIGIVLFAAAFALISVLSSFTGFEFFNPN